MQSREVGRGEGRNTLYGAVTPAPPVAVSLPLTHTDVTVAWAETDETVAASATTRAAFDENMRRIGKKGGTREGGGEGRRGWTEAE